MGYNTYKANLNEAGYYTAMQIIDNHPHIVRAFGWTQPELNNLGRMDVIKSKITNKTVYLYEPDVIALAQFIAKQRELRYNKIQYHDNQNQHI